MTGTWVRNGSTVNGSPVAGQRGRAGQDGVDGDEGPRGPQGPPGPGTGAGAWAPDTAYATNQVVQAPDGSIVRRVTGGTSRASFDATEATLWQSVEASPGTIANRDITATFVRFVDLDGNPIPAPAGVVIKVDPTTGEIEDIISEGVA